MSFLDQLFGGPLPDFERDRPRPPGEVGAVQPDERQPQARTIGGYQRAGTQPLTAYLSSGKGPESANNLTPVFQQRLSAMLANAPPQVQQNVEIYSGWRSVQHQAQLYADAVQKYGASAGHYVAPPGRSYHNSGQASDLNFKTQEARQWFHDNAEKFGMKFPMGHEPWHIEVAETRGGQKFAGQLPGGNDHPVDTPAPVQTAAVPLPTARPAAADAPATTELAAKAAPTAPQPTQEQAFSPQLTTQQEAPALKAITDAVKTPPSTGDVAAAAAAPGIVAPAAAPTPAVGAPAAKEEPPPNLPPPAAAPVRTATAAAAPAAAPGPARISIPPAPASTLGDRMITAMGPRGAGMSTYIDPSTQHQILNPGGSGEEAMGLTRDLGPLSRQTPARAAPAPQRPAVSQPPGAPAAAAPAAPVSPNFVGVRTPRADFSGPVAPVPFAGSTDPTTGMPRLQPDLSGPTPPAPNEAGALAPQPQLLPSTQAPNMGGSLSPFTIGGVQFFPPGSPGANTQPPPPWPTGPVPPAPPPPQTVDQQFGQLPWSPFYGQDPQQRQLALAPFQPDWQSFNATG